MTSCSAIFIVLSVIVLVAERTFAVPTRYDQRQDGELNVRTDLEDVVLVVVPPKDFIKSGMGLLAATAANLLKTNYEDLGFEGWAQQTPPKVVYMPEEKPTAGDRRPGLLKKKISHFGDPNRYNFYDNRNPIKNFAEKTAAPVVQASTTVSVKEKGSTVESTTAKNVENSEKVMGTTIVKVVTEKVNQEMKEPPRVTGEFTDGDLGPSSIFSHEGCGPDAYRDFAGRCVHKTSP